MGAARVSRSETYLTIARPVVAEFEVKRSVFRCHLAPVGDEPAARGLVSDLRRAHHDARHHCTAWVIGPPLERVERSNDDGEPAGTAGGPMLEVLRGRELSDVAAVAIRWFGGTLLGAGGLTRAYGDAVRLAVAEAHVVQRRLIHRFTIDVAHEHAGRLESELRNRGLVQQVDYGAAVHITLGVPADGISPLARLVAELGQGELDLTATDPTWVTSL